jgi:tetratricopeptide (TPR) repeat protein
MEDLAKTKGGSLSGRAIIVAIVVLTSLITVFAIKWQIGDMLSTLADPADPEAVGAADLALTLAPSDPNASSLRAQIGQDPRSSETRSQVEIAEETVRLAPNDYRWRIDLGRALADDGQIERAEAEFKRSVDLAPTYAVCRWYYGNFLLRQGRNADAIAQFKVAAAGHPEYRVQILALLWDVSANDVSLLESVTGDGPENIVFLAYFLAGHGRGADARRNWDHLSDADKARWRPYERVMAELLFERNIFPESVDFSRESGEDPTASFEAVTNPSFEGPIEPSPQAHFNWLFARGDPRLDILSDSKVSYDGHRSLRLNFKGYSKPVLSNAEQTIAVQPQRRYRLTFWVRTENLKAVGGPMQDVVSPCHAASLGVSEPFPNGTNDWREFSVDFTTPSNCSGILVRTTRGTCGGDACAITGIIWLDAFSLARS